MGSTIYTNGQIAAWSDIELIELWLERVAMRLQDDGQQHVAEHAAAREVQRWCGKPWPQMPSEIRVAAAKKFKTAELF